MRCAKASTLYKRLLKPVQFWCINVGCCNAYPIILPTQQSKNQVDNDNKDCFDEALVAFSFLAFLRGGLSKGEGKSNVLGIPLFLLLFLVLRLLLKVPKGTPNLRKIDGKGKAS